MLRKTKRFTLSCIFFLGLACVAVKFILKMEETKSEQIRFRKYIMEGVKNFSDYELEEERINWININARLERREARCTIPGHIKTFPLYKKFIVNSFIYKNPSSCDEVKILNNTDLINISPTLKDSLYGRKKIGMILLNRKKRLLNYCKVQKLKDDELTDLFQKKFAVFFEQNLAICTIEQVF